MRFTKLAATTAALLGLVLIPNDASAQTPTAPFWGTVPGGVCQQSSLLATPIVGVSYYGAYNTSSIYPADLLCPLPITRPVQPTYPDPEVVYLWYYDRRLAAPIYDRLHCTLYRNATNGDPIWSAYQESAAAAWAAQTFQWILPAITTFNAYNAQCWLPPADPSWGPSYITRFELLPGVH
jgi:hypothetical protein